MVAFSSPPRSPRTHRSPRLHNHTSPHIAGTAMSPRSATSSAGATFGSTQSGTLAPLTLGEILGFDTKGDDVGEAPPNTLPEARQSLGDWPPIQEAALVQGQIPSKQKFAQASVLPNGVNTSVDINYRPGASLNLMTLANAAEIVTHSPSSTSPGTSALSNLIYRPSLDVDGFEEVPPPSKIKEEASDWVEPKKPIRKALVRKPTALDRLRASPPPAVSRALALEKEIQSDEPAGPIQSDDEDVLDPFESLPALLLPSLQPTTCTLPSTPPLIDCDMPNETLNSILSPPRQSGKRGRPAVTIPSTPSSAHTKKKPKIESLSSTANTSLIWQFFSSPTSTTIAALPLEADGTTQTNADHVEYEAQMAAGLGLTEMGDPIFQNFVIDDFNLSNESADVNAMQNRSKTASRSVHPKIGGNLRMTRAAPDSPSPAPRRINTLDTTELREIHSHASKDVIMRSPSPTISDLLRDRLSAGAKGKQRAVATPGPSREYQEDLREWTLHPKPTISLANQPFSPNASVASIFPPPPPNSTEIPQYRTPARPSSLVNRHCMFESTLDSRGPAISTTLLAERFPLRESPSPRSAPRPPSPYVEDGEIPDPIAGRSSLLDFVQQQAENAPAEHDDFLTFLPPPIGGFPRVHFSSPTGAFENIDDAQLLDWERLRCNGLVALGISFGGHGALDGDIDPKYRQLISYATHLLNARFHTDRIAIAQPRPKARVANLNSPPHTALLYGINVEEAATLEQEGVMCTPRLAMFFHKLDVVFPAYIGAIHGLTTRVIEPVYDMVLNHFLSPEATRLFTTLSRRPPHSITDPNNAQAYHLNTMYVRRLDCRAKGNTHTPVFLVYMTSPATDYHSYRLWTTFCKKMNLSHSLYGTGHLRSPGLCALCHGHDHPSGLCRFPNIEGWNAPPPYHPPNFSIPLPPSSTRDTTRTPKQAGAKGQVKGKKRRNNTQTNPSTPR